VQRRFYVTPKSFLDMLALFSSMLGEQHSQLTASRERLINGLNKLHETNSAVDAMQQELTALQPTLQQKTASAEQLLAQVGEAACTSSQLM
jgi:dynein heavy chain